MHFIFSRTNRIGGRLIRLFTRGDWDHIALYDPLSDSVYDLNFRGDIFKYSYHDYTVTSQNKVFIYRDILLDRNKTIIYIHKNKHKSYDWWRTIGWPFRKFIKSGRKDFFNCVEYAEGAALINDFSVTGGKNLEPNEFLRELEKFH